MATPRARPTFELLSNMSRDALKERFFAALSGEEGSVRGQVFKEYVELLIDEKERHYWSPRLSVRLRESESGTEVKGRFSPEPAVWTLFMAVHGINALAGTAALIYGFVQWSMGNSPTFLFGVPLAVFMMFFIHGAAFIGQGFGSEQMYQLRAFVDEVIEPPPSSESDEAETLWENL